jgi:hypothetical protein
LIHSQLSKKAGRFPPLPQSKGFKPPDQFHAGIAGNDREILIVEFGFVESIDAGYSTPNWLSYSKHLSSQPFGHKPEFPCPAEQPTGNRDTIGNGIPSLKEYRLARIAGLAEDLVILVQEHIVPDACRTAENRIAFTADIGILLGIEPGSFLPQRLDMPLADKHHKDFLAANDQRPDLTIGRTAILFGHAFQVTDYSVPKQCVCRR